MKIKLSCIETHILTIENNVGRYERLKNELNCLEDKLKINVFYGKTIAGHLGCAISTINMYKSTLPPVLCIEDDCFYVIELNEVDAITTTATVFRVNNISYYPIDFADNCTNPTITGFLNQSVICLEGDLNCF